MSTFPASRRGAQGLFAAIALLYLVFLFPSPEFSVYNKDDAGSFMTLGINLAEYGHYSTDTYPKEDYGHQAIWPPVFPAVLAAVVRSFGVNWPLLKLLMVALGLGNLALVWLLLDALGKYGVTRGMTVATVIGTALSPMYFLFSHMTMTEIPFMFGSTAALLLLTTSRTPAGAAGTGLTAMVAVLTRGYAIAFLPAGFIAFALKRDWPIVKRLTFVACFALPLMFGVVGWSAYTRHVLLNERLDSLTTRYGSAAGLGLNALRPVGVYLRDIYWYHLRSVVHLFIPAIPLDTALGLDWMAGIGAILSLWSAIGWIGLIRRGEYAVSSWLFFSIALMLVAQINGPRYWLTYLPFLVLGVLAGARDIAAWWPRAQPLVAASTAALMLSIAAGLAIHLAHPDQLRFLSPYWKDYQQATLWARFHVPSDAVIVTHTPWDVYGSVAIPAVSGLTPPGVELTAAADASGRAVYVIGPKEDEVYSKLDRDSRYEVVRDGAQVRVWRRLTR